MKILITGANGFVGKALMERLLKSGHEITALVRSKKKTKNLHPDVHWLEGDLLHPEKLPELPNVEKAFYLVHGLKGDDRIFEYQEAMAAVNFVNWLRPTGAGIVYLGGLGSQSNDLSPHLRSRHLTGAILGASGLSLLEFRASIILGEGSLSFEMIKAMSERLPFRPDITLLNQPCQPLALTDLLKYLEASLTHEVTGHKIIEIGGPDVTTYGELLDLYSDLSGLKRPSIKVPDVETKLLMKALDFSIPEHAEAGKKLTESLIHETVVTNAAAKKLFPRIKPLDLRSAMEKARKESKSHYAPLWDKNFYKVLTESGVLSPDLLRNLEKVAKLRKILTRK